MIFNIFTGVFFVSFMIQLTYYLSVYQRVLFYRNKINSNNVLLPVSVIISAKNEAENLKKYLPEILNQDYPDFELIVINDNSTDATADVLSEMKKQYKKLRILNADMHPEGGNKKAAITKAISYAKNKILVFTDADCYPVSRNWLKEIANLYSNKKEIIIGYGAYQGKSGFLNKIIRFETLFNAMQYMSFAVSGFPYMGVGRNLSYKKTLFIKNEGFSEYMQLLSGDDDLFLNKVANKKNVAVMLNADTKTVSVPKKTFKDYLKQKKRHLSTGKYYKNIYKLLLGTEIISRFFFYFTFLFLIFSGKQIEITGFLYLIRIFILMIFIKIFSKRLKEKQNLFFIPIFDILIPLLNLFVFAESVFDKKILWK